MGLFDTVRCEYPLPDPAHQGLEFQTKDFDCLLDEYLITRDGRLVQRAGRGEKGLALDVERPYHGDVRIYRTNPRNVREFIEYVVRFTRGRVEWIRRLDPETRSPADAAESDTPVHEERLRPGMWGRRLTVDEYHAHAPEKLELIHGDVVQAEKLLLLVLTNLGLHRAALLVGPDEWRKALSGEGPEAKL